jgi:hypothetical protein
MGQPTFDNKSHDLAASGFGTRAIHAGHVPDGLTGAVIPPISLSTTFKQTAAGVHKVISITCMALLCIGLVFLTLVLYHRASIILDLETLLATTLRMPLRFLREASMVLLSVLVQLLLLPLLTACKLDHMLSPSTMSMAELTVTSPRWPLVMVSILLLLTWPMLMILSLISDQTPR